MDNSVVYCDIKKDYPVCDNQHLKPLFSAPIDLQEGDRVTINFVTKKPMIVKRNGVVIWSANG